MRRLTCLLLCFLLAVQAGAVQAGPVREWLAGRGGDVKPTFADVAYGPAKAQKMDIYMPASGPYRQIVLMVHGGAWKIGDKAHGRVTENKVRYFTNQGAIFISINYRLIPDGTVYDQLQDVYAALRDVQSRAAGWGLRAHDIVLMGHSAGAHLVALASANGAAMARAGVQPWKGTVVLDSAAMDVPATMTARHMGFYDEAFGANPADWRALSPMHNLDSGARTMLVVCSTRRADPCPQAQAFARAAETLGVKTGVLPQDLSHGQINETLGEASAYTQNVQAFIDGLR